MRGTDYARNTRILSRPKHGKALSKIPGTIVHPWKDMAVDVAHSRTNP